MENNFIKFKTFAYCSNDLDQAKFEKEYILYLLKQIYHLDFQAVTSRFIHEIPSDF
jgi:hypothetical protein